MQSFIEHSGYWAIFLLSVVTSACIPFPSEVVYGFAGAFTTVAVGGASHFNIWAVIVIGTVGSVVGSVIAYEAGRYAGRAIVDRWGKWILLTHHDLDSAEAWFTKWGAASVFFGRIIPVVRAVISVPAGLAEMKRSTFLVLSTLGNAVWVAVLVFLGKAAGNHWQRISHDFHRAEAPIIVVIVLALVWFFWHRFRAVKRHNATR
jgi:membrane protein DedA with SNARE-associated domain